jgi:hypothetical protein
MTSYAIKIAGGPVSGFIASDIDDLKRQVLQRHGHCYFKVTAVADGKHVSRGTIFSV